MSEENVLNDNPAEPIAAVSTVAEAGQPEELDALPPESSNSEHRKKVRNEISEEIAKALNFYESPDMEMIPFPETLTNKKQVTKKAFDKFTQTFFKYMKNLSNRRTMEIIKKNVDHSDESLIFFCSENNLPFTFKS